MELTNEFRVRVPVERAWAVLTDVERIAPCLPGAQLQEIDGDEYRGIVKVKVGPITAQYKGAASFVEREEPRRAVLRAEGRETRGQGGASATITATLEPDGDETKVTVVTDLTITGKVAQFGRGVLADVSARLLGQFVECLEGKVLANDDGDDEPAAGAASGDNGASPAGATAASGVASPATAPSVTPPVEPGERAAPRRIVAPEPEPVDLVAAAGSPIVKRLAAPAAVLFVLWLLRSLLGRRRK